MRIGVDATCWANARGYGRFTREIVSAMAALATDDRFVCLLDERAAERFELRLPNVEARVVPQSLSPTLAASSDSHRNLRDMLRLTRAAARTHVDVFFSPSVYTYFPLPPRLRAVVTVHDAIADRFPSLTLPGWRARAFWRAKVRLALWQARLILTVSEFAAADLSRVLGVPPARIRVAVEAPARPFTEPVDVEDALRAASACGLPPDRGWFVYVGGFNPHKNVDLLVRAHATLARQVGRHAPHLALVGSTDGDAFWSNQARIQRVIEESGTVPLVHWLGFLPDEQLRRIHAGALALVLPSVCEGFGLPAVEAAACGLPVVATTESPLPALLEGGGLFVPPGDLDSLTGALCALEGDPELRRSLGARAEAGARALTWERSARAALAALREAQ